MKPVCRTTVALGAASLIGLGSLSGTGVAALAPASAHAEESAAACSASDFDLITKGHQDMALSGDSGDLSFTVKDDDRGINHDSETFAIEVSDGLKQPLSGLGDSSLPEEGWVLPQTQDPTAPWLGFNTQELSQDLLAADDTATLSMAIAQGPEDGRIVAYQAELGEPTVLMDTEDGSAWDYPGNSHSHPAFAFTKPGTYAVSFTFELPDGSRHHLHAGFLVGKQAEAKDLCGVDYSEADAATGSGNGADSRPKQLEKDIKDVDKSIAGLDKELEKTLQEGQKFLDGGAPDEAEKGKHSTPKKPANTEKSGAPQKSHAPTSTRSTAPAQKSSSGSQTTTHHSASRVNESASTAKSGKSTSSGSHRSASTSGSSHSTAKKSASTKGTKSSSRAKAKSADTPRAQHVPDATDTENKDSKNVLTDAAAYTSTLAKSSFWAGILAGLGAFALALGIGLLVYVQFFRKKKTPHQHQASDATANIPGVD